MYSPISASIGIVTSGSDSSVARADAVVDFPVPTEVERLQLWHGLVGQLAGAAIMRNDEIRNFAFPRRAATPLLSRYEPGMNYGPHADAPFLQLPTGPMRSDVSATLFIGEPASYEGGELVIHLGNARHSFKGEPGSMILYPSTTLHEVAPITSGQRLSMFTFMESVIPNQIHRELLYTLNEVSALEGYNVSWENRTRLQFVIANLHRMWAG